LDFLNITKSYNSEMKIRQLRSQIYVVISIYRDKIQISSIFV